MTFTFQEIGSDGLMVLPPEWIVEQGLKDGDWLTMDVENGFVVIRPAKKPDLRDDELA